MNVNGLGVLPVMRKHIDGLVQERRNSSALAMELRLSCTSPSIWLYIICCILMMTSCNGYAFRITGSSGAYNGRWVPIINGQKSRASIFSLLKAKQSVEQTIKSKCRWFDTIFRRYCDANNTNVLIIEIKSFYLQVKSGIIQFSALTIY